MKVYFTCSIRGVSQYRKNYERIYSVIESMGYQHVGDDGLCTLEHQIYENNNFDMDDHNRQTTDKIHQADVVVIEVSVHSLSMGYVMHAALSMGKPVVALHVKNMRPAFLEGIQNDLLQLVEYDLDSIEKRLKPALELAGENYQIRFTMLIWGKVRKRLDKVAEEGTPRADYIRKLILKDKE